VVGGAILKSRVFKSAIIADVGVFHDVLMVDCLAGVLSTDRIGQRPLFLSSFIILSICLGILQPVLLSLKPLGDRVDPAASAVVLPPNRPMLTTLL
jgi:hypothetical protein